jgi:hypothetical protein
MPKEPHASLFRLLLSPCPLPSWQQAQLQGDRPHRYDCWAYLSCAGAACFIYDSWWLSLTHDCQASTRVQSSVVLPSAQALGGRHLGSIFGGVGCASDAGDVLFSAGGDIGIGDGAGASTAIYGVSASGFSAAGTGAGPVASAGASLTARGFVPPLSAARDAPLSDAVIASCKPQLRSAIRECLERQLPREVTADPTVIPALAKAAVRLVDVCVEHELGMPFAVHLSPLLFFQHHCYSRQCRCFCCSCC